MQQYCVASLSNCSERGDKKLCRRSYWAHLLGRHRSFGQRMNEWVRGIYILTVAACDCEHLQALSCICSRVICTVCLIHMPVRSGIVLEINS